ncbi:type II toxin-antitoxin system Phd/YefM family antitoxin [Microbacterium sp.]|uniref:type II toxin-antitoxin system Phd/YefM family antitoxin n=1 Tax=Microbacterium sp. TaxID=51671 RepID=UPI0039E34909
MARTIPHRELRNNSSRILDEVRRGETIHITNHGVVVATLIPPQAEEPPCACTPRATRAAGASSVPARRRTA